MTSQPLTLEPNCRRNLEAPVASSPAARKVDVSFQNATRIQESVTSVIERKFLLWLAPRIPLWINSDHLTLLGLASMFLASGSYVWARRNHSALLLVNLFLALNWFGDSMDGTLARARNRQRPRYGFYVDHMIDSVGAVLLMGGLAFSRYIHWQIATALLVAFLLLSIETYLASYTLGIFRMSFAKFGPTEIRLLLALGNTVLWLCPDARVPRLHYRLFDFAGLVATVGMGAMLLIATAWHTKRLYGEERLP
jgi:phosphatidylglycerophosphate synthase